MVYTCATQRPLDLSCMHMHSAVNDVYKITSDPCRRHTNLCLQAETDMITVTTDEGRRVNGGSDTNVVF